MIGRPRRSTLFPYTTLFRPRSRNAAAAADPGRDLPRRPAGGRRRVGAAGHHVLRSEEHTSELQSQSKLVCRLLLEKKKAFVLPEPCVTTTSVHAMTLRTVLA